MKVLKVNTPARKIYASVAVLLISFLVIQGCAPKVLTPAEIAARDDAVSIATDAYIYGYPLVTMEYTKRSLTNVVDASSGKSAPVGQFARLRTYPAVSDKRVTAPNADTLYTLAWLDLSKEPTVFSIPDMKGRYYLMPMLDGWTDVFQVPGKRTTGTKAQKYLITGPGWHGVVPEGLKELKSPTALVWILGRIYCTGTPEDYKEVHALQDQFSLVPLSSYGKPYTPPPGVVDATFNTKKPVRDQVNDLDIESYFNLLSELMVQNPPAAADAPILAQMAKIGLVPGQKFELRKLDAASAEALKDVPQAANEKIMMHFDQAGTFVNGWMFSTKTGLYGTDYLQRATITAIGLGANRPQDAVYPTTQADAHRAPYDGTKQYVIHFDKGKLPPANAFWSITMYDDQYFFVPNKLNRYTVSSRSKFSYNKDGSVDIYFQNKSPGKDKESNWLPAPKGKFVLMMRLYWPREKAPSIIDGSWAPPQVVEVK